MIDIRTLSLATGFSALVLCVPLLAMVRRHRAFPGVRQWALGLISVFVGMALIGLRGKIPDFFSVVLGNTITLAFLVFNLRGMKTFLGEKQKTWSDVGTLAVPALGMQLFLWPWPDMSVRIGVFSLFSAVMQARFITIAWVKFPRIMPRRDWVLLAAFALYGAWHLVRAVLALVIRPAGDFMSAGFYQGMTFFVGMGMMILMSSSLFAALTRRLENDLSGAKKELQTLSGLLPICSFCKRIHGDDGSWTHVESYISTRSELQFSHGLCPECIEEHYPETGDGSLPVSSVGP